MQQRRPMLLHSSSATQQVSGRLLLFGGAGCRCRSPGVFLPLKCSKVELNAATFPDNAATSAYVAAFLGDEVRGELAPLGNPQSPKRNVSPFKDVNDQLVTIQQLHTHQRVCWRGVDRDAAQLVVPDDRGLVNVEQGGATIARERRYCGDGRGGRAPKRRACRAPTCRIQTCASGIRASKRSEAASSSRSISQSSVSMSMRTSFPSSSGRRLESTTRS
jgi:hypothetical protein